MLLLVLLLDVIEKCADAPRHAAGAALIAAVVTAIRSPSDSTAAAIAIVTAERIVRLNQ